MRAHSFFRPVPGYRKWTGGGDQPTVMVSLTLDEVEALNVVLAREHNCLTKREANTLEALVPSVRTLRDDFRAWAKERAS